MRSNDRLDGLSILPEKASVLPYVRGPLHHEPVTTDPGAHREYDVHVIPENIM